MIEKAYRLASEAHKNQKRKSGEPYIIHPLCVAIILADLEMDKETFLNLKRDEIVPFIEEEVMVRYYFQEAGIKVRLKYDEQLKEALTKPLVTF